jgi:hypothetical protein
MPKLQLVDATEPKLTSPTGYTSVKVADKVAESNAFVFVIVMVNKAVPPAAILAGEKFFETRGLDGATKSLSAAEQTPPLHKGAVFVFVTLAGGEITTVLVTCVCPIADKPPNTSKQVSAMRDMARRAQ